MNKTDLIELAEQCEAATGPDGMLSDAIFETLGITPNRADRIYPAYDYTASLDAAMTLVPEDYDRVQQEHVPMSDGSVRCWASVGDWRASPIRCATPALALCAAALRARAAQTKGE